MHHPIVSASPPLHKVSLLPPLGSHLILLGQEVVGVCLKFDEVCFKVTDFDRTKIFNRRKKITGWITVIIYPVGYQEAFLGINFFFLPGSFPVPRDNFKRKRNTSSVSDQTGLLIHDAMLKVLLETKFFMLPFLSQVQMDWQWPVPANAQPCCRSLMAIAGIKEKGTLFYCYVLILVRAANNITYFGKKLLSWKKRNLKKPVLICGSDHVTWVLVVAQFSCILVW